MIRVVRERPEHGPEIERLLDLAFGPLRTSRPSYELRRGASPLDELSFVALQGRQPLGTIRFFPVTIGEKTRALLLGPLAVHPDHWRKGIGTRLMHRGLRACREQGHRIVVVIGTKAFLGRFGFGAARAAGLRFDERVGDDRFLVKELAPGALHGVRGAVRSAADGRYRIARPPPGGESPSAPREAAARSRRDRSGARA